MKTVVHTNVDGYEIVRYFGDALVDSEATLAKMQGKIQGLNEYAHLEEVRARIAALHQTASNHGTLAQTYEAANQTARATSHRAQAAAAIAQIPLVEAEAVPLIRAFEAAQEALYLADPVYFAPGPGESIISDADHAALKAKADALAPNQQLTVSGAYVVDYRGCSYWQKGDTWTRTAVEELGTAIPKGAILEEKLTGEQRAEISAEAEAARLAGLSAEAKAAEKAAALDAVLREAAAQKTMAEIKGETFDAAAWYAAKKAEIETKYGYQAQEGGAQ